MKTPSVNRGHVKTGVGCSVQYRIIANSHEAIVRLAPTITAYYSDKDNSDVAIIYRRIND